MNAPHTHTHIHTSKERKKKKTKRNNDRTGSHLDIFQCHNNVLVMMNHMPEKKNSKIPRVKTPVVRHPSYWQPKMIDLGPVVAVFSLPVCPCAKLGFVFLSFSLSLSLFFQDTFLAPNKAKLKLVSLSPILGVASLITSHRRSTYGTVFASPCACAC